MLLLETGGLLFDGMPYQTLIAIMLCVRRTLDTSSKSWKALILFVRSLSPDVKQAEVQQLLP